MKRSGRDKEHVPLMNFHLIHKVHQSILFNVGLEDLLCDRFFKAIYQLGPGLAIQYHPHLCLSIFPFNAHGIRIIRMNLNGQIVLSIDQLKQNGKRGEFLAADSGRIWKFAEIICQGLSRIRAVFNGRTAVLMATQLPAFCQRG